MSPSAATRAALFVASASLLAFPPRAAAQNLGGGRIDIEVRIPDPDPDNDRFRLGSEEELIEFFNLASCECDEPFQVRLRLQGDTQQVPGEPVYVYVGEDCDDFSDPDRHDQRCELIQTFPDVRTLRDAEDVLIPAGSFMFPNGTCEQRTETKWIYVLVEDRDETDAQLAAEWRFTFDTQPPPAVADVARAGAEGAAQIEWSLPEARADDLHEYQVLCARVDGADGPEDFGGEPKFQTEEALCGLETTAQPRRVPVRRVDPITILSDGGTGGPDAAPDGPDGGPSGPDAGGLPDDLPDQLAELDSGAICASVTGGARTSIRVSDLENGVPYHIVLVAIDRARNFTPMYLGEVEPQPAVDYWDDYKDRGGGADGGFCFVATASFGGYDSPNVLVLRELRDGTLAHYAPGRAFIDWYYEHGPALAAVIDRHPPLRVAAAALLMPLVGAAAIWNSAGALGASAVALTIFLACAAGRRARRRALGERPGGPGLRAAAALAAAAARAQMGDFDDMNEPVDPPGPPDIEWNTELKLGAYQPAMDRGLDDPGPFETMFGSGPFMIAKLTVDRFFLYPGGQLGLTATAGYFSEGARAFTTVDDSGDPCLDDAGERTVCRDDAGDPIRSEGDTTAFRMLPASIGVVYRYTQLDDHLGVPFVPYGRVGASYYLWWVTQPDGSVARTGDSRARGGSFGWEASAGLALRAERLDPSSARSLRNEFGIAHAGFFVEAGYARVDSFGRENRLPVGGLSLLGGINFEF